MNTLTLQQALEQLRSQPGQYNSRQALLDLVSQVSVHATGDVTLLYSGQPTPGITPQQIFKAMELNGESIRIIDNTDAARFLDSSQFKEAFASHYGLSPKDIDPIATNPATLPPIKQAALTQMNEALYHPTDGPWANASARFVDATEGEVRTFKSQVHALAANTPQFERCA